MDAKQDKATETSTSPLSHSIAGSTVLSTASSGDGFEHIEGAVRDARMSVRYLMSSLMSVQVSLRAQQAQKGAPVSYSTSAVGSALYDHGLFERLHPQLDTQITLLRLDACVD